jgi:hypothetical protein
MQKTEPQGPKVQKAVKTSNPLLFIVGGEALPTRGKPEQPSGTSAESSTPGSSGTSSTVSAGQTAPQPVGVAVKGSEIRMVKPSKDMKGKGLVSTWSLKRMRRWQEGLSSNSMETGSQIGDRSRGFAQLIAMCNEMGKGGRSGPKGGRGGQGRGGYPKGDATLVRSSENSYVPSAMYKAAGMWDENSEEAFRMTVKQELNRLTAVRLNEVKVVILKQINEHKANDIRWRRGFVASVICEKGAQEPAFSEIYAQFLKALDQKEIENTVATNISNQFRDAFDNPGEESDESQMWSGCAGFVGHLTRLRLLSADNTSNNLSNLMKEIKAKHHGHHVEMLGSLVEGAGQEFARGVSEEIWNNLNELIEDRSISPRLRFLMKDVSDRVNDWLLGRPRRIVVRRDAGSDGRLPKVRSAFSDFLDDESRVPRMDLSPRDFLEAALELLPDQAEKDPQAYCVFIRTVLMSARMDPREPMDILVKGVERFQEQNLDADCPQLWLWMTKLLCEMIIYGLVSLGDAEVIRSRFGGDRWDPVEDLKWYIYDTHDFSQEVDCRNIRDDRDRLREIKDALSLPRVMRQGRQDRIGMSRLIAVGVVRTACNMLQDRRGGDWKGAFGSRSCVDYVRRAGKCQERAFKEAMMEEIRKWNLDLIRIEEVMRFVYQ